MVYDRPEVIAGGSVSIAEAERRLFNPKVLAQLTRLGIAESLLEIVHLGTELEDVQSLVPDKLAESLAQMQTKSLTFLNQQTIDLMCHPSDRQMLALKNPWPTIANS